jgi:hypothetical protein
MLITFNLKQNEKNKMLLGLSLVAVSGLILVAADHIDAPLQCQETQVIHGCLLFMAKHK